MELLTKADFWYLVAAAVFGLWAIAIPIGIRMWLNASERLMRKLDELATQFQRYSVDMEARMKTVEVNQHHVLEWIQRQDRLKDDGK